MIKIKRVAQIERLSWFFGKSMEGGCWKDGIAPYPIF